MIKHTTTGRWKLGIFLSLITVFFWGVAPIALKIVLEDMGPFTIAWYRFLFSAALIGVWIFKKQHFPALTIFRGSFLWLMMLAIFGLGANYAFFMIGLNYLPPSTAAVVIQLAPMFLLFGSILFFKESFRLSQSIGFFILVFGLILFFNTRFAFLLSGFSTYASGIVLVVCAAILWAVYALAQKQLLTKLPSATILLFIYIGCFIILTPFSKPAEILKISFIQLLLLIFTGLNTIFAYGSFSEALNHLEASRVSMTMAIIPLITIGSMKIFSILFPGLIESEPLNLLSVVGAFMVVLGSMASSLSRSEDT
ncbi:MAG: DMT family transporter [Deltaproteobacteria bacterium]|nr:DMT family transporter [Deltaproteobacteria bacterium]